MKNSDLNSILKDFETVDNKILSKIDKIDIHIKRIEKTLQKL